MGTASRTAIVASTLGGWALVGLGALIGNGQGALSATMIGLGVLGLLVGWVWAIVASIQVQRWGWLVGIIVFSGIAPLLYGLVWPKPAVTGPLGVDRPLPPSTVTPSAAPLAPTTAAAPSSRPAAAPPQWEYCEIEWYDEGYFAANAVGPRGHYSAGQNRGRCKAESANLLLTGRHTQPGNGCQPLLNELITALTADGWELTGETGQNWWNQKFRRLATR
jgi:hypothetical protein